MKVRGFDSPKRALSSSQARPNILSPVLQPGYLPQEKLLIDPNYPKGNLLSKSLQKAATESLITIFSLPCKDMVLFRGEGASFCERVVFVASPTPSSLWMGSPFGIATSHGASPQQRIETGFQRTFTRIYYRRHLTRLDSRNFETKLLVTMRC